MTQLSGVFATLLVQFSAPIPGDSQVPISPAPGNLTPASGWAPFIYVYGTHGLLYAVPLAECCIKHWLVLTPAIPALCRQREAKGSEVHYS